MSPAREVQSVAVRGWRGIRSPKIGGFAPPPLNERTLERRYAAPFLIVALLCGVFAFVHPDASSYWIDELFTLFVIDHQGGLGEVLRRALSDTHPPFYYFVAYGWLRMFGPSEAAMRLLSALLSSGALAVLFFGLKPVFSLPARSFGLALAAGSKLFFEQSQNARGYGLALFIAAALLVMTLAAVRRWQDGRAAPLPLAAAIWLASVLGSFTHFYLFLAVGAAHLFLLLRATKTSHRLGVLVSGLSILALVGIYVVVLLHRSEQDLQNMWFSNNPGALLKQLLGGLYQSWSGFGLGAVVLLVLARGLDRVAPGARFASPSSNATTAFELASLTIVVTLVAGLAVSFVVAPSFGKRNLMVLGPCLWVVAMWGYDAIFPNARGSRGAILFTLIVAMTASNALFLQARRLPRTEDWRASAAYVNATPMCAGATIPVVLPFLFGPSKPFFRHLAERYFFGRYDSQPWRLSAYTPEEFAPATGDAGLAALLRARGEGDDCPILAWGVHDLTADRAGKLADQIAATAGLPKNRLHIRTFRSYRVGLLGVTPSGPSAYVFLRVD